VTITDKRIIRYFMTIQEASQLVIQAGAMARRGELFVLDMGKPVKIYDLAVNMIKLSGLEPGKDIMIEEVGLRPGEKLYEELLLKSESQEKTENNLIFIERDTPQTREAVDAMLRILDAASESHDVDRVRAALAQVVPTYKDSAVVNSVASQAKEMQMVNC
jgi:FlaA1/EpsC-like NDP-sugar epimerase